MNYVDRERRRLSVGEMVSLALLVLQFCAGLIAVGSFKQDVADMKLHQANTDQKLYDIQKILIEKGLSK